MKIIIFVISSVFIHCNQIICQNTVEVKDEVNILVEKIEKSLTGEIDISEYTIVRSQLTSGSSIEMFSANERKTILSLFYDNDWNVETTSYYFNEGQKHNYLVRKGLKKKLEFDLYLIGERRYFENTHGTIKKIPNEIFEELVVSLSYALEYK